jgi:hypothetical protein
MRPLARRLARLEQIAARPPLAETPALPPALPQRGELAALAPQLAQHLRDAVEGYKQFLKLTPQEALAQATAVCPSATEEVRNIPPDRLSWGDLETLYRSDPPAALAKWVQAREAAREELRGGVRAAGAIEAIAASPVWLARFLAVRDELTDSWQPRGGMEQMLLDLAAQVHTLLLSWQGELIDRMALGNAGSRREAGYEQMRLDDAQAVDQAMGMIERLHGMLLRTLKSLRDLRRGTPRVVVGRAGQVNIAERLVNINAGHRQMPGHTAAIP